MSRFEDTKTLISRDLQQQYLGFTGFQYRYPLCLMTDKFHRTIRLAERNAKTTAVARDLHQPRPSLSLSSTLAVNAKIRQHYRYGLCLESGILLREQFCSVVDKGKGPHWRNSWRQRFLGRAFLTGYLTGETSRQEPAAFLPRPCGAYMPSHET
jgi:hypothetical protein